MKKEKIESKQKSRFSTKDAKIIKRFLEEKFPEGFVDAKQVLEYARPRNSPIHKYFDWDDRTAAEKYRLQQAQKLIQCVVVEINNKEIRKYVSPVVVNAEGDKAYVEIETARRTPDIWHQVLAKALQEAGFWRQRYLNLKELSSVHVAIERAQKKLKKQGVGEWN